VDGEDSVPETGLLAKLLGSLGTAVHVEDSVAERREGVVPPAYRTNF